MADTRSLTIVQLNDSHSYFDLHREIFWEEGEAVYRPAGGYARIASLLREIRSEEGNVLFCDCGDTFHGTYPALQTRGQGMVPIMNALRPDGMAAHWEFAYGPKHFRNLAGELDYPMLAANIYDRRTDELFFPPYAVQEIGELRVGMVGIASNIIDKTMPPSFSEGVRFTLGREELPPVIETLRSREKADLIVLISHLGFPQDMKLISEVEGIDVCLSGHTHHRLYRPVLQGKTLVIQSGCHGSFLGRLDLEIAGGRIVGYSHELMEVKAGISPDPEVEALVEAALAPYRDELSLVVGETATPLNRSTTLESTMDNFLLQSLLETTGAQMAFSNGWRYGAPVVPGPVTMNDLYNIIPMNPRVSTVELTGEELREMLEENLERTFAADPYNQMGGYVKRCLGLRAYIKIENPAGHRIQKLFAGREEVRPSGIYQAAFVTEQGVAGKYGRSRQNHSDHAVEAMKKYLAAHRPVTSDLRGTFIPI